MIDEHSQTAAAGRPLGAISTLVSLFLLLLVFFVMLFSIAQVHAQRVQAVVSSIDLAFGGLPSRLGLLPPAPEPEGEALNSPEGFARAVSALIKGMAPLEASQARAPLGSLLEIDLPPEQMFRKDGAALTPGAEAMVPRLALLLQHRPSRQQHYRLAFRLVVPDLAPGSPDAALALARAGTFAAALYAAGGPAEGLAIGLEHGEAAAIRLDFALIGPPGEAE